MFKFYILSILLTILWSLGVRGASEMVYIVNLFPFFGLLIWNKKVNFSIEVLLMILLIIYDVIFFAHGYVFALKIGAYLITFDLMRSVNVKIPVKNLKRILLLAVLLFFINKYTGIASKNFFFQRNSFPSFLFGISALIAFGDRDSRYRHLLFGIVALTVLLSGTIGALLALLISYILTSNIRYLSIKLSAVFVTLVFSHSYFTEIAILSRLYEMYQNIFSKVSFSQLLYDNSLSYGTFAKDGFTDVSALFRLFHWKEILLYHFSDNIWYIIFGQGFDSVKYHLPLSMHKYPHNDIIRIVVESGLLFGTLFFRKLWILWKKLRGYERIYITALFVFLFTENLLNNFISTLPLFYLMGITTKETMHERSSYKQL